MIKRIGVFFSLLLVIVFASSAKDFSFFLNGIDQHPEILGGFLPTGSGVGVNYDGFSLIPGNLTRIRVKAGAGYLQRQIFQNPADGSFLESKYEKIGIFDEFHFTWSAEFSQGFGNSWVDGKDYFTAYAGYEGKYERFHDSLIILPGGGGFPKKDDYKIYLGEKSKGQPDSISAFMERYGTTRSSQIVYPDLAEDSNYTSTIYAGMRLNALRDTWTTSDGAEVNLKVQAAPDFMNKTSSYFVAEASVVAAHTVFESKQRRNALLNKFSVVVIDRLNMTFIGGDSVPVFASHVNSLGRKMRGVDNNSYNTSFTYVNNLDVRFSSPEPFIHGIFARLNLFLDIGYGAGEILNTTKKGMPTLGQVSLLASTGGQLELDIFDTIDLGLQVAYLMHGENLRNRDDNVVVSATFFLDF